MKRFRSLLLQKVQVRTEGLHILRLRLHRHLPEVDALEPHSHSFGQLLFYLSGGGTLLVAGKEFQVPSGTVAWIPSGKSHGFLEQSRQRALCLAIDIQLRPQPAAKLALLNHSEGAKIRHQLSELSRLKNPASMEARLLTASAVLAILDVEFRALGFLPRQAAPVPAFIKKYQALVENPELADAPISELTKRMGYQPDYLNRRFKQSTGLTLRQHRDAARLQRCKDHLLQGLSVSEAATRNGFADANYFSRWFRRYTGTSPSRFGKTSVLAQRRK